MESSFRHDSKTTAADEEQHLSRRRFLRCDVGRSFTSKGREKGERRGAEGTGNIGHGGSRPGWLSTDLVSGGEPIKRLDPFASFINPAFACERLRLGDPARNRV